MPNQPNYRRWPVVALVSASLMLAAAGCSFSGTSAQFVASPSEKSDEDNQEIAATIQPELSALPGAVSASASYENDIGSTHSLSLGVVVRPGTKFGPIFDEATRLAWVSEVSPLSSAYIVVSVLGDPQSVDTRIVDFGDDGEALQEQYGPRPD